MNKPTAPPLRAILYSRVSSTGQADNTSHETQYEAGMRWAQTNNCVVLRYYMEVESGALYLGRSELQKALSDLEADVADVLVIYDFSRYSREREFQETIRKRVERANKRLAFTTLHLEYDESGEMTPESGFLFGALGATAAYERAQFRRRSMAGRRKSAENGRQPATKSPYGYHIVTDKDILAGRAQPGQKGLYQIVESQAAIVRELFALCESGHSLSAIATQLNRRGVPSPGGARWRANIVQQLLRRRVYKGLAHHGRQRRVVDESRPQRGFKGTVTYVQRPDDQITWIPCPAIVEPAQWERVQARLDANRAARAGRPDRRYMLSGLLRCPHCGAPMRGKTMKYSYQGKKVQRDSVRLYYACDRRATTEHAVPAEERGAKCPQTYLQSAEVERRVVEALLALLDSPDAVEAQLRRQEKQKARPSGQADKAREELKALEKREKAVFAAQVRAIETGGDPTLGDAMLSELATQKAHLKTLISVAQEDEERPALRRNKAEQLVATRDAVRRVLLNEEIPAGEKHALLTLIVARIEWRGDRAPRLILHEK